MAASHLREALLRIGFITLCTDGLIGSLGNLTNLTAGKYRTH